MAEPRTIKRYELHEELGRGGMAVVYKAIDTSLDRVVAIKLLHPHLASRPESSRRFAREARAVAKLRHPNIVEIYDFAGDEQDGEKFIVTEFIEGGTLREFVEKNPIEFPEVGVSFILQLCDALEHAHGVGIIHRDIKPENVMIGDSGRLKLMDFGIAHVLDADRMTASGSLLGSPAHMPPEIVDGRPSDKRGDIFSLGTVLYYVTTNTLPFVGNSPTAVLRNIIDSRYLEPSEANPKVSRHLSAIIRKCMETDPDRRYDTVTQLRDALREELATIDIDDPLALSSEYVADPAGFAKRFKPLLVERLLNRATHSVEHRDLTYVSDLLNRVLTYEPDDKQALVLLSRLQRGRRIKVLLSFAVASAVLLGGGYFLVQAATQRTNEAALSATEVHGEAVAVDVAEEVPLRLSGERVALAAARVHGSLWTLAVPVARERLTDRLRAVARMSLRGTAPGWRGALFDSPRLLVAKHIIRAVPLKTLDTDPETPIDAPKAPKVDEAGLVSVELQVFPFDAEAIIDRKRFKNEDGDFIVKLAPGSHDIMWEHPECFPSKQKLHVVEGETKVTAPAISLNYRPGVFVVKQKDKSSGEYFLWGFKDQPGALEDVLPGKPMAIEMENTGREKTIVIYAIPQGTKLESRTSKAVRKYPNKQVSVGPGKTEPVLF